MENQINVDDQNTQQIGQNAANQPVQSPEKPKLNYWIISTFLLLIILLSGGVWLILNTRSKTSSYQQSIAPTKANETVVTGVFRTSGLSEEEKQKFGLTTVNYQITDFGDYQKVYQEEQVMGYYLLSNNVSDELLGKCIRVAGSIPEEWKNKNKADAYDRLALNVTNVDKIDNSNCNPYAQTQPNIDNTQEKLVLRGEVVRAKRPAPDIGYDYQLKLTEPFIDKFSSAGSPQKVSLIDISSTTNNLWNELENNINKEISVEGYMAWGYAESRYLQIVDIQNDLVSRDAAFTLGAYKNCHVYPRSSMNILSSDITLLDRSEVRCEIGDKQETLLSILDKSGFETAKNNVYRVWKDTEGYKALLVDQNGGGSGDGNGKIILLSKNTYTLKSCFYYTSGDFSGEYSDPLSGKEMSKVNGSTLKSSDPYCNNFVLKSTIN